MSLADYHFDLPPELIAQTPLPRCRDARLLHLGVDGPVDRQMAALPTILRPGDLLVFNDTRVIPARLQGHKASGGAVELMVERVTATHEVRAFIGASKSPAAGATLTFGPDEAQVLGREGRLFRVRFAAPVAEVLARQGQVPLPPYIDRAPAAADAARYQTVFARVPGAVAAPTAGLHFDAPLLEALAAQGIGRAFVTLHVGAGTFAPLREQALADNRLHAEWLEVSEATCQAIAATRAAGGRIVAVGTTSARALETAAAGGEPAPYAGETELFIQPGYRFRGVDLLLTNFHLPQSSLLVLVAAFAGRERVLAAYRHAVAARYRFYSYGDACLLEPGT